MRITSNFNTITFQGKNKPKKSLKEKALWVGGCTIMSPLFAFCDGWSLKEAYRNKKLTKELGALIMLGGVLGSGVLLFDNYISDTKNEKKTKLAVGAGLGALFGAINSFAVDCFLKNAKGKTLNKQRLAIMTLGGGAIGAFVASIKNNKN